MDRLRTIVTALIVCALAILPAASASAAMRMAGTMGMATTAENDGAGQPTMHSGCENHADMAADMADGMAMGQNIAKSAPSSDDHGACPVSGCAKCPCLGLAVNGVLAVGPLMPSYTYAGIPTGWTTPSLLAPSILPPSPPPRA